MSSPIVPREKDLTRPRTFLYNDVVGNCSANDEFPFLFASDPASDVGKPYGAFRETRDGGLIDNRTLFIIDGEGRVAWRAVPYREVDPSAYVELREALDRLAPATGEAEMQ